MASAFCALDKLGDSCWLVPAELAAAWAGIGEVIMTGEINAALSNMPATVIFTCFVFITIPPGCKYELEVMVK
jgi:hypothetical protein